MPRGSRRSRVDVGLHLNFTTPGRGRDARGRLLNSRRALAGTSDHTGSPRSSSVPDSPGTSNTSCQRPVGRVPAPVRHGPDRFNGHHHMHLCANVLASGCSPRGSLVRRNFSFRPGERGHLNPVPPRRSWTRLARRHRLVDLFFSLPPLATPKRLRGSSRSPGTTSSKWRRTRKSR